MTFLDCPLCGNTETRPAYIRAQETGSILGRVQTTFVICQSCGFMYMNPRVSEESMRRHYASEVSSGNVYHENSPDSAQSRKNQQRMSFLHPFIPKNKGVRILEVGCSTGDFLGGLWGHGWNLTGIEPSPYAAAVAVAAHPELDILCCSLEDANVQPETQDVVCCFSVLEHVYDVLLFGSLLRRLLKQGGILCLEVPDTSVPVPQISEFFCFEHLSHFTPTTISLWLFRCGFGHVHFDAGSGSRLRLVARRQDLPPSLDAIPAHLMEAMQKAPGQLGQAVSNYRLGKQRLEKDISQRLDAAIAGWKSRGARVAVYGAGAHTDHLFAVSNLAEVTDAIIDSDPRKEGQVFQKWRVQSDRVLGEGTRITAVVISSKSFQNEMAKRARRQTEGREVDIFLCYGEG